MKGQEYLDLVIDYMLSKKEPSYSDGLESAAVRDKAMQELNAISRCEYLLQFAGEDIREFHEKQRLDRGETITRTYVATIPNDEPKTPE